MKELFEQAAAGIARLKRNSEFIGSARDSAPTPSQGRRGMHFRTEGGNGVADTAGIVLKNADDTFTRKYFTLGGTATDAGAEILFYPINGGGVQIATGVQRLDLVVPYACTITGWTLLADQSGSIVVDIWKDTYANFSTYNTSNSDMPGYDEVYALKLDGSGTAERFGHIHHANTGTYEFQAQAVPNRDGSRVLFASAWDGANGSSNVYAFVLEMLREDSAGPPGPF